MATRRGERADGVDKKKTPIRFGLYNIKNVRKVGLESALRGMSQDNLDLGVLQETNIMYGV